MLTYQGAAHHLGLLSVWLSYAALIVAAWCFRWLSRRRVSTTLAESADAQLPGGKDREVALHDAASDGESEAPHDAAAPGLWGSFLALLARAGLGDPLLFVLAAFDVFANALSVWAIETCGAGMFQVVYSSILVCTAAISSVALRKTFGRTQWLAMAIVTAGLMLSTVRLPLPGVDHHNVPHASLPVAPSPLPQAIALVEPPSPPSPPPAVSDALAESGGRETSFAAAAGESSPPQPEAASDAAAMAAPSSPSALPERVDSLPATTLAPVAAVDAAGGPDSGAESLPERQGRALLSLPPPSQDSLQPAQPAAAPRGSVAAVPARNDADDDDDDDDDENDDGGESSAGEAKEQNRQESRSDAASSGDSLPSNDASNTTLARRHLHLQHSGLRRGLVGILLSLACTVLYAFVYVAYESLLSSSDGRRPSRDEETVSRRVGRYGFGLTSVYVLAFTLPNADALIVRPVTAAHGSPAAIAVLYALLFASSVLHSLTYFQVISGSGAVAAGILQALRAVAIFSLSAHLFCHVQRAQCFTYAKGMSSLLVIGGVVLFSFASHRAESAAKRDN